VVTVATPGELDLHLFAEGRHRRLWEWMGAHAGDRGTEFAVWAPNATSVEVVGDWSGWTSGDRLEPNGDSGVWTGTASGARTGQAYKFRLGTRDGASVLRADPYARWTEVPPATASRISGPSTFAWSSGDWRAERSARNAGRLSVYEVHLGSWRRHPDGQAHSYRQLAVPLAEHVAGLGFTHLELMPVAAHPFGGSWGYQVTGYFAPDARQGNPDDLRHLVDVAHRHGLGVIVDWVPGHFPRDEGALARFDGTALYEHADPKRGEHPDWGTYEFNFGRHEVAGFLLSNALYWLEEFRVDALRVDAVASMLYLDYSRQPGEWVPNEHGGREDLEAIAFLRQLNDVVAEEHQGAMVIAEESTAWGGVTAPTSEGGLGFSRKWNLGWMHDTLAYFAHDPVHRRFHHGELTWPMHYAFDERWILPMSHDEVVHGKRALLDKMPGDEWQRRANLRALLAWQWSMPGDELVFMGTELAQPREWSHDRELDWWLASDPDHAGIATLIVDLNRLSVEHPALWRADGDARHTWWQDSERVDESTFAFGRHDPVDGGTVLVVANLTPVPRPGYRLGLPPGDGWRIVLDTDRLHYGGTDAGPRELPAPDDDIPWQHQERSLVVTLPPLAILWIASTRSS
jgi:1,4-alpha-glucan branching enzyme